MKADGRFGPAQVTANKAGDLTLLTTHARRRPRGRRDAGRSSSTCASDIVPQAFAGAPAKVYVTGNTAGVVDYLGFFDTLAADRPGSWSSA